MTMVERVIRPTEERHLHSIRQWIYRQTGLYYPERKYVLLYQRLQKVCWRFGIPGLRELDRHLQEGDLPGLSMEVACAVSTHHTYFFREGRVMQFLQEQILPQLPGREQWRIWSAATSGGDEAYTVAILLAETLGLAAARQRAAILGTDLSHTAIAEAEQGEYDARRLESVPRYLLRRYFRPTPGGRWRVTRELRQMCTFRRLNLMSTPWPFRRPFHVVLCRNVLYYFDREHQRDLVERLYRVTAPEGWLITSITESLEGIDARWERVVPGVYRRA